MKNEKVTVTVSFGADDAKKEFSRDFVQSVFENSDDILNSLQTKEGTEQILKDLNSGVKSRLYLQTRNAILAEQAGPEKSFAKLVQDIIKNRAALGKPVTEDQARKMAEMIQGLDTESAAA
jgi:hypothetical protein